MSKTPKPRKYTHYTCNVVCKVKFPTETLCLSLFFCHNYLARMMTQQKSNTCITAQSSVGASWDSIPFLADLEHSASVELWFTVLYMWFKLIQAKLSRPSLAYVSYILAGCSNHLKKKASPFSSQSNVFRRQPHNSLPLSHLQKGVHSHFPLHVRACDWLLTNHTSILHHPEFYILLR